MSMTISIKRKPKVSKRKLTKKHILELIKKAEDTINEHEYNSIVKKPLQNIHSKNFDSKLAEELEYFEKKHPDLYDSSFFNKLDQELKIKEIKEYFEKLNNFFNNKNVGKFTIQKEGPFTKISKRQGKGKSNKSKKKGKGKSLDSLELPPLEDLEDLSDKDFEKKTQNKFFQYKFDEQAIEENKKLEGKKLLEELREHLEYFFEEGDEGETAKAFKDKDILKGVKLLEKSLQNPRRPKNRGLSRKKGSRMEREISKKK